jgi:transcription elongation factor GreA
MNKTNTSDEVLQLLLDHLNIVEESREMLLKEYFTEETEESKKLQRFFREYVTTLKNYVQNSKVTTKGSKIHPVVIIGSVVEVEDMEDHETYKYRIVLPFSGSLKSSYDCASCLSPLGKALLFRKINDKVDVEVPTGKLNYYVKSITPPDSIKASIFN